MPECSGAPKVSKPASENSRLITASWAKLPPAPPYSSGFTGLGPHLAVVHAGRVPAVDVGDEFIGDEAPRLLFEQDQVLGHPGRARQIDGSHGGAWPIGSRDSTYTPGVRQARGAASYPAPSATATL